MGHTARAGGLLLAAMPRLPFLQEYLEFRKERSQMLLSRRNQMLLEFSFWNEPQPRAGPNIYELRTYKLKVPLSYRLLPSLLQSCFTGAPGPRLGGGRRRGELLASPSGPKTEVCMHLCIPRCKSGPLNEARQLQELGRHDTSSSPSSCDAGNPRGAHFHPFSVLFQPGTMIEWGNNW